MLVPIVRCEIVRDGALKTDGRTATGPRQVAELVREFIGRGDDREHFIMLAMDARNKVLAINLVSLGTLTASLVHPREVFKPAILAGAAGIVVAHNHPSGECRPSAEDRAATHRLKRAGEIIGIPLLDHVVVPQDSFYSFREDGGLTS